MISLSFVQKDTNADDWYGRAGGASPEGQLSTLLARKRYLGRYSTSAPTPFETIIGHFLLYISEKNNLKSSAITIILLTFHSSL
jgi:hypothetical protein